MHDSVIVHGNLIWHLQEREEELIPHVYILGCRKGHFSIHLSPLAYS